MKNKETSRHHKICKSRGGANEGINVEQTRNSTHRAIHTLFENQLPLEKLGTLLSLDEAVLTEYYKNIILDILRIDPKDAYLLEAFRNKSAWKKL